MRRGRPSVFAAMADGGARGGIVDRQATVFARLEFSGQEGRATGMALDLAAEVLRIVPLRTSTIASRARPCSSSTARRIASSAGAKSFSHSWGLLHQNRRWRP